jgi:hypothetical protein
VDIKFFHGLDSLLDDTIKKDDKSFQLVCAIRKRKDDFRSKECTMGAMLIVFMIQVYYVLALQFYLINPETSKKITIYFSTMF